MFYVGRQITVTLEGSVWKPIRCEFCQLEWVDKERGIDARKYVIYIGPGRSLG